MQRTGMSHGSRTGIRRSRKLTILAGLLASGLSITSPAMAAVQLFTTTFTDLNGSAQNQAAVGHTGLTPTATGQVSYDAATQMLSVLIQGTGFEPGIPHVAHIHGNLVNPMTSGSGALDSFTPTAAQDVDHDGFIELFEGLQTYGPILFDLMNIDPNMDGTINYNMTFNLLDPNAPFGFINPLDPSQGRYGIADLVGLSGTQFDLRELVIHGLTVPAGVGIDNPNQNPPTDDEVNGHSTFAPGSDGIPFGHTVVLPVASGELVAAVPEPTTWAMMLLGFGAIGFSFRRRKASIGGLLPADS